MRVVRAGWVLLLALGTASAAEESKLLTVRIRGPGGEVPGEVFVEFLSSDVPRASVGRPVRDAGTTTQEVGLGRCEVRARHAKDARGVLLPWGPARREVAAEETEVVVRMPLGSSAEGRVLDADGEPVAGLSVLAVEPGDTTYGVADPLASAITDAEGHFRVQPLGEDPVDLVVAPSAGFARPPPLETRGGARDIRIRVHRVSPVTLEIADPGGVPVPGAKVLVWKIRNRRTNRSGFAYEKVADGEGRVQLGPLDPRLDLALELRPPATRGDLSSTELDPWKPVSAVLRLPAGFTAILRVRDEEGRVVLAEVERLPTWVELPGFNSTSQHKLPAPDKDGRLAVPHLALGTQRFSARPLDGVQIWPGRTAWVAVSEQQPEADLVVTRRAQKLEVRVAQSERGQTCYLFAENDGRELPFQTSPVREDGVVQFSNLAQGDYSIYVLTRTPVEEGGRVASRARFTLHGGPVPVATIPAMSIRVRPRLPVPGLKVSSSLVYLNGHRLGGLREHEDGTWSGAGLPIGRYGVVLFGSVGDRQWSGQAYVEAGETVEIALEPWVP